MRANLVGVDTAGLPSLSVTGMPNAIPRVDAALPSLLDDLPGRAVVVVNPRITMFNAPVGDWSDIRLLFFGADGRWRRLSLADLGLSDSLTYTDTYDAGELSVDGRWWAGPMRGGMVALNLTTGAIRTLATPVPGVGAWTPGRHSIVSFKEEFTVPGGVVTRVPYTAAQVGYEPDGTPLSLERGPNGQAVLVEWRGRTRHTRAVVPGISPPRRRIATDSARLMIAADQLIGVYPTQGQFATGELRGRAAVGVVVVDSGTGEINADLTRARGELAYHDVWLDDQTLLIAKAPYFVAWRPSTGKLFRVTDARSLRSDLWDISVASGTLAR